MNLEQIEVTIGTDGKVKLHASGFSGEACLEATEALEALLGGKVTEREATAEAYDTLRVKNPARTQVRNS